MLRIYNIKNKKEYIEEVAILTQNEWGKQTLTSEEYQDKINRKVQKILKNLDKKYYSKLILLKENTLVGFISIFEHDCKERPNLAPWYATMFVKEEFRGKGYSRILNDAILEEAKKKKINRLYLKTTLDNYYEKLGAKFLEIQENGEKIYCFEIGI